MDKKDAIATSTAEFSSGKATNFPRAIISKDSFDFSFSGIKTAVLHYVKRQEGKIDDGHKNDIVASFQEAVVDVLVTKAMRAAKRCKVDKISLAGGVAANTRLREKIVDQTKKEDVRVFIPSPHLCTDNAAMIAAVGDYYLEKGITSPLTLNASSRLPIGN